MVQRDADFDRPSFIDKVLLAWEDLATSRDPERSCAAPTAGHIGRRVHALNSAGRRNPWNQEAHRGKRQAHTTFTARAKEGDPQQADRGRVFREVADVKYTGTKALRPRCGPRGCSGGGWEPDHQGRGRGAGQAGGIKGGKIGPFGQWRPPPPPPPREPQRAGKRDGQGRNRAIFKRVQGRDRSRPRRRGLGRREIPPWARYSTAPSTANNVQPLADRPILRTWRSVDSLCGPKVGRAKRDQARAQARRRRTVVLPLLNPTGCGRRGQQGVVGGVLRAYPASRATPGRARSIHHKQPDSASPPARASRRSSPTAPMWPKMVEAPISQSRRQPPEGAVVHVRQDRHRVRQEVQGEAVGGRHVLLPQARPQRVRTSRRSPPPALDGIEPSTGAPHRRGDLFQAADKEGGVEARGRRSRAMQARFRAQSRRRSRPAAESYRPTKGRLGSTGAGAAIGCADEEHGRGNTGRRHRQRMKELGAVSPTIPRDSNAHKNIRAPCRRPARRDCRNCPALELVDGRAPGVRDRAE